MKILVNATPLTNLFTGISRYVSCLYQQTGKEPGSRGIIYNKWHVFAADAAANRACRMGQKDKLDMESPGFHGDRSPVAVLAAV